MMLGSYVYTTYGGLESIFRAHRWLIGETSKSVWRNFQVSLEKLPSQFGETSKSVWRNLQVSLEKLQSQFGETSKSIGSCKMQCSKSIWKPSNHFGDPSNPFLGPLQPILGTPPDHFGDPSSPLWRPPSPNSE